MLERVRLLHSLAKRMRAAGLWDDEIFLRLKGTDTKVLREIAASQFEDEVRRGLKDKRHAERHPMKTQGNRGASAPYPIVLCEDHPNVREPGYVVCPHVVDGSAPVSHFLRATDKSLGEVTCHACFEKVILTPEIGLFELGFVLSCAEGVRLRNWDIQ